MAKEKKSYKTKLKNVRLAFPSLYETEKFNGEDTGKYAATFMLHKKEHKELIEEIKEKFEEIKEEYGVKKLKEDKTCLTDGEDFDTDSDITIDYYFLKASNRRRPLLIDRDKSPLTEEDDKFYPGCRVNAVIDFWFQDNEYGKRINANLLGVQFARDDERFGGGAVADIDDFDEVEYEDDFEDDDEL